MGKSSCALTQVKFSAAVSVMLLTKNSNKTKSRAMHIVHRPAFGFHPTENCSRGWEQIVLKRQPDG